MEIPETRYATTADGVSIAYQVLGDGPLDIVFANSAWISNVEMVWELFPLVAALVRGLASRGRVIWFDRRGTGLSDPVSGERLPTLEARMEDIRTVMDAAGAERPVLVSIEDAGAQCFLFAATYPERARALVTANPSVVGRWSPDAPWGWTEEQWAEDLEAIEQGWGTPQFVQSFAEAVMPTFAKDPEFVRGYGRIMRVSLSKADALASERMWMDTDVRDILSTIQTPTQVFWSAHVQSVPLEECQYVAQRIPGAEFVRLERPDLEWGEFFSHFDRFVKSLQEEEADFDRVLATVLFTDIVGATERAADLGDRAW
ncbi:MAG TPA: alpha/beta hydrolase, partial [Actinomycetota bacterium]|nr:alpha/beta hydrolase [Actinomycetota bacterium]